VPEQKFFTFLRLASALPAKAFFFREFFFWGVQNNANTLFYSTSSPLAATLHSAPGSSIVILAILLCL
jgi:hypothetical protein